MQSGTPTFIRWDGRALLHRAIHNSTAEMWEAAGRPPLGSGPGDGEVIAHFASGNPILRYSPAPPMVGTTGEIDALSLWAGQSVALAKQSQPAAEIVSRRWFRACNPLQQGQGFASRSGGQSNAASRRRASRSVVSSVRSSPPGQRSHRSWVTRPGQDEPAATRLHEGAGSWSSSSPRTFLADDIDGMVALVNADAWFRRPPASHGVQRPGSSSARFSRRFLKGHSGPVEPSDRHACGRGAGVRDVLHRPALGSGPSSPGCRCCRWPARASLSWPGSSAPATPNSIEPTQRPLWGAPVSKAP